jgi:hypothetical protein
MPFVTGINPVVSAYTAATNVGVETVFPGGVLWVPPTAARVHAIVSSAVTDASPSGTGARTVIVTGYTSASTLATETVALNGTTPVNTSGSYIHIAEIDVATAGSVLANTGIITATAATDSTITAAINIGDNRSSGALLYVVDKGEQLRINRITVSASALGAATVSHTAFLVVGPVVTGTTGERRHIGTTYSGAITQISAEFDVVIGYGQWARVDVHSSAASTVVAAHINYTKVA